MFNVLPKQLKSDVNNVRKAFKQKNRNKTTGDAESKGKPTECTTEAKASKCVSSYVLVNKVQNTKMLTENLEAIELELEK